MKDDKTSKWSEPAQVVKESDTPRSYDIQFPNGKCVRRNRRHLQAEPQIKKRLLVNFQISLIKA